MPDQPSQPQTDGAVLALFVAAATEDERSRLFEELVQRHGALVLGICRGVLRNEHDAEDAAQATFITLAHKAESLTDKPSVAGWLHHVARCVALDARKSAARRALREKEAVTGQDTPETGLAERQREQQLLHAELDKLPEEYRAPVVLHHLEGRTVEDAAQVLGVPVRTFYMRMARAKEMLRKRLASQGVSALALFPLSLTGEKLPPLFAGSTAKAATRAVAGKAAGTGAAAALALAALKSMRRARLRSIAETAAAAAATAALLLVAVSWWFGTTPLPRISSSLPGAKSVSALAAANSAEELARKLPFKVTPRDHSLPVAFEEAGCKGLKVIPLGGLRDLQMPVEMRFKRLGAWDLVEGVATANGLQVAWLRDAKCAVLYAKAPAEDYARAGKDLASAGGAVRAEAAWRCGWLPDIRVIPLLVKAARDPDAEVASQAVIALRRLGWTAALTVDDHALELIWADLFSPNSNSVVRAAAVRALAIGGQRAVVSLEKALADEDENVRAAAATALGSIGGAQAQALLRRALTDLSPAVRREAAFGLREVADEKILLILVHAIEEARWWPVRDNVYRFALLGGKNARALISAAAESENPSLRFVAYVAMNASGEEWALPLLEHGLNDASENARSEAIAALGGMAGQKALVLLAGMLKSDLPKLRARAAWALGRNGSEDVLPLLQQALEDADSDVRCRATRALGEIGRTQVIPLLEQALRSADERVRVNAVYTLRFTDRAGAMPVLKSLVDGQAEQMRLLALQVLGQTAGDAALPLIGQMLSDQDVNMRLAAVTALKVVRAEKTLVTLDQPIADNDARVRAEAASVLGQTEGPKALARLEMLLADQDTEVRRSAIHSLGSVGGPRVVARLGQIVSPPLNAETRTDEQLRSEAVMALGRAGGAKALGLLEKALTDASGRVRLAAACALLGRSHIGQTKKPGDAVSASEHAKELFEIAVMASDTAKQRKAARALVWSSAPDLNAEGSAAPGCISRLRAQELLERLLTNAKSSALEINDLDIDTALPLLEDRRAALRWQAVYALWSVPDQENERVAAALISALEREKERDVWQLMAKALKLRFANASGVKEVLANLPPGPVAEPKTKPPRPAPVDF